MLKFSQLNSNSVYNINDPLVVKLLMMLKVLLGHLNVHISTILAKIFGTKERNLVKVGKTLKICYLILHVF